MGFSIYLVQGDITARPVEAIVNAANTQLILGSGVAGSIRLKGGAEIQNECNLLAPIELGKVALTGAGRLPMKYILHAATMHLGGEASAVSVSLCVKNALALAEEKGITSLAFPALGCGVGGLSLAEGVKTILQTLQQYRDTCVHLQKVELVLYSLADFTEAQKVAQSLGIVFQA